jgi:hypothetical protein
MIIKTYHFLYYCYYNLVSSKVDHREDGASSLLTVLNLSLVVSLYLHLNIAIGRRSLFPAAEGFGVFFVGAFLGVLNWIYFIKRKHYVEAVSEFNKTPHFITTLVGLALVILPLPLFIFSGIKTGNYLRSIH